MLIVFINGGMGQYPFSGPGKGFLVTVFIVAKLEPGNLSIFLLYIQVKIIVTELSCGFTPIHLA